MALHLTPDSGDPGEDRATAGSLGGAEAQLERRLLRDGHQVITRGALVCPECELPMPAGDAVPASRELVCSWCGHAAPAMKLIRVGAVDAPASAAALVARLS